MHKFRTALYRFRQRRAIKNLLKNSQTTTFPDHYLDTHIKEAFKTYCKNMGQVKR